MSTESKSDDAQPQGKASGSVEKPSAVTKQAAKADASVGIDAERVAAEKKKKLRLPGILFNLLLLGGLGLLAMMFYEQKKSLDLVFTQQDQSAGERAATVSDLLTLQNRALALDTQLVDAADRISAQDLRLNEANNLIVEQSRELEGLNRELVRTRLRINDSGTAVNQEWLLAEAESLLRLAQQGLIVTGDVRAAIALFIASDDILKQINDPAIFSIRDTLAIDLRALRAVPEIDVQSLYLSLGELSQRVGNLQVVSGIEERLGSTEEIPLRTDAQSQEPSITNAVINKLSEYIVVRRRDEAIQPLLTPTQQIYLKQNIQLQIQQARLALLREQKAVFTASLEEAISNIQRYLSGDGFEKQSIILALTELQNTEIIVRVPAATSTLNALRAILPANNMDINNQQELQPQIPESVNNAATDESNSEVTETL